MVVQNTFLHLDYTVYKIRFEIRDRINKLLKIVLDPNTFTRKYDSHTNTATGYWTATHRRHVQATQAKKHT
jgi:hypothetical protein